MPRSKKYGKKIIILIFLIKASRRKKNKKDDKVEGFFLASRNMGFYAVSIINKALLILTLCLFLILIDGVSVKFNHEKRQTSKYRPHTTSKFPRETKSVSRPFHV